MEEGEAGRVFNGTNSVMLKLAGILSDEEAKAIEKGIKNLRRRSRKRTVLYFF